MPSSGFRGSFSDPAHLVAPSCKPVLDRLARPSTSFASQPVLDGPAAKGTSAGALACLGAGASAGSHSQGAAHTGGWLK